MSTDDTLDFIAIVAFIASLVLGTIDVIECSIDKFRQPKVLLMVACLSFAAAAGICIMLKLILSCW